MRRNLAQILFLCVLNSNPAIAQGFPGHWVGRWIWNHGESHPFHYFVMARRDFDLQESPSTSTLHITAEDRYLLYLNGQYLGRGPARSDARWKSYDTYDVSGQLHRGKNVLAVLGYYYGTANNYSRDVRAGLFVQLEISKGSASEKVIGTDHSWKVRPAQGWRRDVRHISQHHGALGMTEVYNANLDPPNWTDSNFDDSTWESATVIADHASPWSYLEPRQTPMMREQEIFPIRVVQTGEVMDLQRMALETEVPERLTGEPHYRLQYARIEDSQALLHADGVMARLQSSPYQPGDPMDKGVRCPFLIVDFGRAVFGFPRVRMNGASGGIVEMTYGPDTLGGRVLGLSGALRLGDRYVTRQGQQTWQVFEYKQFRYLQIVFRNITTPLSVDSLSLVSYNYPAPRRGKFECSDATLTKLWKACVDTTYLQMEDALVCDATRERRVFAADGGHGLHGVYAGYGDIAIVDWYFRLLARSATMDGMIRPFYPGTEQPVGGGDLKKQNVSETPLHLPQGALMYAVLLGEHYQYFGKRKLVEELYPALVNLDHWFQKYTDEVGLLYNLPFMNWLDWSANDMRGANFQTNALYSQMLVQLSRIAVDLGHIEQSRQWQSHAERIKDGLRRLHWNSERQLYTDSVLDGKKSPVFTEVANGMALLYDIATDKQAPNIIRRLIDPSAEIARSSPLFFHYPTEGLIRAGAVEPALRLMRERYGPMMEFSDAPSIWESWLPYVRVRGKDFRGESPSWVHSGGVSPAWTLSRYVLGVLPSKPGFQKCRIEPRIADLDWARGIFPSVRGDIHISWKKQDGYLFLETELPDGLETELALPRPPSKNLLLIHNGKRYSIGPQSKGRPGLAFSESAIVLQVTGGIHHLELFVQ